MLIVGALFAALMSAAPAEQGPLAGLDDYVNRAFREFEHPGLALAIVSFTLDRNGRAAWIEVDQFGKFGRAPERPAP